MTQYNSPEDPIINFFRWLWSKLFKPKNLTLLQDLRQFFGPDFEHLETHEKHFPGYDLASLNYALTSYAEDFCASSRRVGGCPAASMEMLLELLRQPYGRTLFPSALTYQRVPVDVDEEQSFVTNGLHLAEIKTEGGSPEKVASLLAVNARHESWDGMGNQNAPQQALTLSLACRNKEVADRFFRTIEERRKRLSIYRGKVIDPVVSQAGILTVGFRAIHKVKEEDLVLRDQVRELIQSSIVGFYQHREVLEHLGIELKRGILFHSPPGTGKTSISLYLASKLPHFTVCFVSGERLLFPREICRMARYLQPSMIVFEDIDLVAQERSINGLATVLGELMNQIDGCEPTDQVLFIMNTNSLDRLEHAVKNRPGRVDQIISIPLPDGDERRRLIEHFARNFRLVVDEMRKVLEATDGATPAMLKEIVKRAAVNAVQRNGGHKKGEVFDLTQADLLLATEQVRSMRDPEAMPGTLGFREVKPYP